MSINPESGLLTPRTSIEMLPPPKEPAVAFLDLPGEILSQIASSVPLGLHRSELTLSYLSMSEILGFLSLHPTLLSLSRTHLSPLPHVVRQALLAGQPYPPVLAYLPSLPLYQPDDDGGRMWVEVLVRARPKWILERMQHGRWRDAVWKEAFERRFLPSWERYKGDVDSWRAIFLRLEHRYLGCTHEESWTRFVTLHRNGSASLNRIYSRLFDPYEIYDELKHQNNFSSQPTQVRVILHLQDVRILALGVLHSQPCLFVNPNAHLVLHPPLLRNVVYREQTYRASYRASEPNVRTSSVPIPMPTGAAVPSANRNEAYFELVRSISPSGPATTSYGLGEGGQAGPTFTPSQAGPSQRRSTLASLMPGKSRRTSAPVPEVAVESGTGGSSVSRLGAMLTQVRSRDSDDSRSRKWSFGRSRAGSTSAAAQPDLTRTESRIEPITPTMPILPELDSQGSIPNASALTKDAGRTVTTRNRLPYVPITRPAPAPSHALYPNFTPAKQDEEVSVEAAIADAPTARRDFRPLHEEVEDDYDGTLWSAGEAHWTGETKMAEWDAVEGVRRRWVGPMILIAQLHAADRTSPLPPGANPAGPAEGSNPDLGPKGMYVSLGFEDLQALMPWVELRGGGAHSSDPRRGGLGFE